MKTLIYFNFKDRYTCIYIYSVGLTVQTFTCKILIPINAVTFLNNRDKLHGISECYY